MGSPSPRGRVLVVVAHPDDESFGLGAVIVWLRGRGVAMDAVVLTHGEASTLGATGDREELARVRSAELACASRVLGLGSYNLHDYPDGELGKVPLEERARRVAEAGRADALLAFDWTGITGHEDHIAATEAAEEVAGWWDATLYLWSLPRQVAEGLNARLGTPFQGRPEQELPIALDVTEERGQQWEAIHCHRSQLGVLEVVRARLEALGNREYLLVERWGEGPDLFGTP